MPGCCAAIRSEATRLDFVPLLDSLGEDGPLKFTAHPERRGSSRCLPLTSDGGKSVTAALFPAGGVRRTETMYQRPSRVAPSAVTQMHRPGTLENVTYR